MRAALSTRLQNFNSLYWSDSELNANIIEALRCFNSYTGYWRNRVPLTLTPNTAFYNLSAIDPGFSLNVTDTQIVTAIQSALLEPPTGTTWTGTDQFTYAQVSGAVQNKHNQFLEDTGILVNYSVLPFPSPPVIRLPLPQGTIDVRRVAWRTVPPVLYFPLSREDERTVTGYQYKWNISPTLFPTVYSMSTTPPLSIQLAPPPVNDGQIELITVSTGPALNPSTGVTLSIPDDFSYAVKWGALATLLSTDGQSRDFERVAYCIQRYTQAVSIALTSPSLLQMEVSGLYLSIDSLTSLDGFSPSWQNSPLSTPLTAGLCGRNLIALSPIPDRAYTSTVDTVINIPVPVVDSDFIQVGPEYYSAILDYAHHISCFKMGGQEFSQTMELYSSFLKVCTALNGRLSAIAGDRITLDLPATLPTSMTERVRASA